MKQYKKEIISLLATESSTTSNLSQTFLKANKNYIINKLKIQWELFLSTYQYSKQNLFFEYFYSPYGLSVDVQDVKRYSCVPMSFQGLTDSSSEEQSREKFFLSDTDFLLYQTKKIDFSQKFFYLKQEKFSSSNYFIFAKIVDLLGAQHSIKNKFRQLIKTNIKYLELEKLFHRKVLKKTSFLSWISSLLIEQIYQFIKMNSLFLYQVKFISPFGPVWGKKNKIEIQNHGNFLFCKCQDFLLLKWYQNKIHTWCEAQILNKTISFNQLNQGSEVLVAPTSHIRNALLRKGDVFGFTNTISYSQDERNNFSHRLRDSDRGTFGRTIGMREEGFTLSAFARQRSLRLIKKIIQKSKVTTQGELIQKLNEIIGSLADTFIITNRNKRSVSIKFNRILYQFLWRWGLVRHKNQKAKWIKNRYWSPQ